jgi:hypothetical protein
MMFNPNVGTLKKQCGEIMDRPPPITQSVKANTFAMLKNAGERQEGK